MYLHTYWLLYPLRDTKSSGRYFQILGKLIIVR